MRKAYSSNFKSKVAIDAIKGNKQKESKIIEGHLMPDHLHMMISIPPKYAVSQVIGFIKGVTSHLTETDFRGIIPS